MHLANSEFFYQPCPLPAGKAHHPNSRIFVRNSPLVDLNSSSCDNPPPFCPRDYDTEKEQIIEMNREEMKKKKAPNVARCQMYCVDADRAMRSMPRNKARCASPTFESSQSATPMGSVRFRVLSAADLTGRTRSTPLILLLNHVTQPRRVVMPRHRFPSWRTITLPRIVLGLRVRPRPLRIARC